MKNLYEYNDYRVFLSDYYKFNKRLKSGFSHRYFLEKAGLKGPNFLKNVIDGKRNLSKKTINKFSIALGLSKRETGYFSDLVLFNQAKTVNKKQYYFNRLSRFSLRSDIQELRKEQYEYLSCWYNVAVREYIHAHRFSGEYEEIVNTISPKITLRKAKNAVRLLEKLRLIKLNKEGYYILKDPIITTDPEISGIGAHQFHKDMLGVGIDAFDNVKKDDRYFRTVLGSFSEETFQKIRMELDSARKKILNIISEDRGNKKVYSLGMQLYPLEQQKKNKRMKRGRR